jgi:hypothetical protein
MKIKPVILCWEGQYEKVCKIEESLKDVFPPATVSVYNTNSTQYLPHWESFPQGYFFRLIDQFIAISKTTCSHGYDAMLMIQGDVRYDNWHEFVREALLDERKISWGIYAPNFTTTPWNSKRVDLRRFSKDPHLALVTCTDTIVWFIKREILERILELNIEWEKYPVCWGLDIIASSISYSMGLPVIRNYNHLVEHSVTTSYHQKDAFKKGIDLFREMKEKHPDISEHMEAISNFHFEEKKMLPLFNGFNYNICNKYIHTRQIRKI